MHPTTFVSLHSLSEQWSRNFPRTLGSKTCKQERLNPAIFWVADEHLALRRRRAMLLARAARGRAPRTILRSLRWFAVPCVFSLLYMLVFFTRTYKKFLHNKHARHVRTFGLRVWHVKVGKHFCKWLSPRFFHFLKTFANFRQDSDFHEIPSKIEHKHGNIYSNTTEKPFLWKTEKNKTFGGLSSRTSSKAFMTRKTLGLDLATNSLLQCKIQMNLWDIS